MFCHISRLSIQRTSTATKEYALGTGHYLCGGGGGGGGAEIMGWARPIFFREKGWAKREFHDDWGWVIVCVL